jgi:hypothetical protein
VATRNQRRAEPIPALPKPSKSGRKIRYARPSAKPSLAAEGAGLRDSAMEALATEVVDLLAELELGSGLATLKRHFKVREKQLADVLRDLEQDGFVYREGAGLLARWHLG